MSSFKFAQVAGAVSQNLGLFAEQAGEKEKREADRLWAAKMDEVRASRESAREQRTIDRETGREERSIEREGIRTEAATARSNAATEATAGYRSDTLDQNESQFTRSQVARQEESLQKRLQELDEQYQKTLESPAYMGEDPEGQLQARHMDRRDQEIVNFVERMASRKAVGYETAMNSKDDFASAVGMLGIHRDSADYYSGQMFPDQQPALPEMFPDPASVPGQTAPGQPTANAAIPTPPQPGMPGGLDANSMQGVAGQPINMVQPTPSGGYRSPNQRMIDNVMKPGAAAVGDWLGKPRQDPNENPYALMGQQGG